MAHVLYSIEGLSEFLEGADFIDAASFEGDASVEQLAAEILSYSPWWVSFLFWLRRGLARILRLKQAQIENRAFSADDIPTTPGETINFFTVRKSVPGTIWVAGGGDRHLDGILAIAQVKGSDDEPQLHLATIVHFRHWIGRFYFTLIRPFHVVIAHYAGRSLARKLNLKRTSSSFGNQVDPNFESK